MAVNNRLLLASRYVGLCSACCFFLALLCLGDAVYSLLMRPTGQIDLVAGQSTLVNGPLPAEADSLQNVCFSITGEEAVTCVPVETFSGFWLGGLMWRARIQVPENTPQGTARLTATLLQDNSTETNSVADPPVPAVTIAIWKSRQALQEASLSLLTRYLGVSPGGIASAFLGAALFFGLVQWVLFRRAYAVLEAAGFRLIYGIKKTETDIQALFSLSTACPFQIHERVLLFTPQLLPRGAGTITALTPPSGIVSFDTELKPGYGFFIKHDPAPTFPAPTGELR